MGDLPCVFAGPSLYGKTIPQGVMVYPPARLGSVWHAVQQGHRRIAVIDGVFGNQPAVWHKEILFALAQGCTVIGAASMGALRAVELAPFGMIGVGAVYRLYRRGAIVDDAEVALLHVDYRGSFAELTVPLIDLRFTLRSMQRQGQLSTQMASQAMTICADMHFSERDWATITAELVRNDLPAKLAQQMQNMRVYRKSMDARMALDVVRNNAITSIRGAWEFYETSFWQHQFIAESDSIPALEN